MSESLLELKEKPVAQGPGHWAVLVQGYESWKQDSHILFWACCLFFLLLQSWTSLLCLPPMLPAAEVIRWTTVNRNWTIITAAPEAAINWQPSSERSQKPIGQKLFLKLTGFFCQWEYKAWKSTILIQLSLHNHLPYVEVNHWPKPVAEEKQASYLAHTSLEAVLVCKIG